MSQHHGGKEHLLVFEIELGIKNLGAKGDKQRQKPKSQVKSSCQVSGLDSDFFRFGRHDPLVDVLAGNTSKAQNDPSPKVVDPGIDACIGEKFGTIDLAILDNGQYDKSWRYVHMLPDEILLAAQDLNTARVLPVHSGKFVLANHSWDEPLEKIVQNNAEVGLSLITPKIGEKVRLQDLGQEFSAWWREIN